MFTGIDLIVIALVVLAVFYLSDTSSKDFEFKLDPMAFLVVGLVVLMIVLTTA
ncbi:MAG TPA: hypothetical protein V6D06_18755 [Trichocoleus sp.]